MLCYKIQTNGNNTYVSGHEAMEDIQFSLFYSFGMPSPHVYARAKIKNNGQTENALWQSDFLKIGDTVSIRLIESDTPDQPYKHVPIGAKLHPIPGEELHCSFCGSDQGKVKKLIRGAGGNICNRCIHFMEKEFQS